MSARGDSEESWSGKTSFRNNRAAGGCGGAVSSDESIIHWSGETTFVYNTALDADSGLCAAQLSDISWNENTEFAVCFLSRRNKRWWSVRRRFKHILEQRDSVWQQQFNRQRRCHVLCASSLLVNGSTMFNGNTCTTNGGGIAIAEDSDVVFGTQNVVFFETVAVS